ncbi:hypothetical protein CPL00134L_CDS0010 [Escherichia phage Phagiculus]
MLIFFLVMTLILFAPLTLIGAILLIGYLSGGRTR